MIYGTKELDLSRRDNDTLNTELTNNTELQFHD
jgi:hypothetical protein